MAYKIYLNKKDYSRPMLLNQYNRNIKYTFEVYMEDGKPYIYKDGDVLKLECMVNNEMAFIKSTGFTVAGNKVSFLLDREITLNDGTGYMNFIVENIHDNSRNGSFRKEIFIEPNSIDEDTSIDGSGNINKHLVVTAKEELDKSINKASQTVKDFTAEAVNDLLAKGELANMAIGDNSITETKYQDNSITGSKLNQQYTYKGFVYGTDRDINTIVDSGSYYINADVSNLPETTDFLLDNVKFDTSSRVLQKLYPIDNQSVYYYRIGNINNLSSISFNKIVNYVNYVNLTNLVDNNKIKEKTFINPSGGGEVPYDDYSAVVEYIPLDLNNFIGIYNKGNGLSLDNNAIIGAYYDDNKSFVDQLYFSGSTRTNCEVSTNGMLHLIPPVSAKYVRFCINDLALGNERKKVLFTHEVNKVDFVDKDATNYNKIENKAPLSGKIIVNFGDSIFGNEPRGDKSISNKISKKTGALVFNAGFGGCQMSTHAEGWNNCSMYSLADYIKNDTLSELKNKIDADWSGMPGYFTNTGRMLAQDIDFNKVDMITISYGTNDYREAKQLDNPEDKYDVNTVCGALRYSCRSIWVKYPHIKILVTTPIYRYFIPEAEGSDTKNWGGGTLLEYSDAIKQTCKELKIQCLDLYNISGLNEFTKGYYYFPDDNTHPNEKGRDIISSLLASKIEEILK